MTYLVGRNELLDFRDWDVSAGNSEELSDTDLRRGSFTRVSREEIWRDETRTILLRSDRCRAGVCLTLEIQFTLSSYP